MVTAMTESTYPEHNARMRDAIMDAIDDSLEVQDWHVDHRTGRAQVTVELPDGSHNHVGTKDYSVLVSWLARQLRMAFAQRSVWK